MRAPRGIPPRMLRVAAAVVGGMMCAAAGVAVLALPPAPAPPPGPATSTDALEYWRHYPERAADRAWLPAPRPGRYLRVVPDAGGFNNIRLAFEVSVVLALLTGRTLVLPRRRPWYLLGPDPVGFEDFFDLPALAALVPWVAEADWRLPPGERAVAIELDPLRTALAVPTAEAVRAALPPAGLATREAGRRLRGVSDGPLSAAAVLTVDNGVSRLLATWHTLFVFADPERDAALKRLMRRHVRYAPAIFAAAAAAVDELGGCGEYAALHVRRGDFQYREVKIGSARLLENVRPLLERGGAGPGGRELYILTDERNASWFAPFGRAGYRVRRLGDLRAAPPAHLAGMVEQLVGAAARVFVGTRLSTFSSYVVRLRGYLARALPAADRETYYADRRYTGLPALDGGEAAADWTNTALSGGELATFREPRSVWDVEGAR